MSETLDRVQALVAEGRVNVSRHGFRELAADAILLADILDSVSDAVAIEDYPDFWLGPSVLVLQQDRRRNRLHVVWGLPRVTLDPAILVTAYRPDPRRWSEDLMRRAGS